MTVATFLLLLALIVAAALGLYAAFRRSIEWGLLAIVLVLWLFASLVSAGLQVR